MPEIILDTCVLSNFALSRSLFIIQSCYNRKAYITSYVLSEVLKGLRKGYKEFSEIKRAVSDGWMIETSMKSAKEKELFEVLSAYLGLGESSSIAVAKNRGFTFASDDLAARREADILQVPLTGSVGILVKAININIISLQRGETILAIMKEHGSYSPVTSLHKLISLISKKRDT